MDCVPNPPPLQDVLLALSEEVHRLEAEKKGATIDLPQYFQAKVSAAPIDLLVFTCVGEARCQTTSGTQHEPTSFLWWRGIRSISLPGDGGR